MTAIAPRAESAPRAQAPILREATANNGRLTRINGWILRAYCVAEKPKSQTSAMPRDSTFSPFRLRPHQTGDHDHRPDPEGFVAVPRRRFPSRHFPGLATMRLESAMCWNGKMTASSSHRD